MRAPIEVPSRAILGGRSGDVGLPTLPGCNSLLPTRFSVEEGVGSSRVPRMVIPRPLNSVNGLTATSFLSNDALNEVVLACLIHQHRHRVGGGRRAERRIAGVMRFEERDVEGGMQLGKGFRESESSSVGVRGDVRDREGSEE